MLVVAVLPARNVVADARHALVPAAPRMFGHACLPRGQHLVAVGGLENDPDVVDLLIDANRHARMGELYREAHTQWQRSGGELAVYFSSCEAPGKYGSWGALEYQDQPQSEAPKWAALRAIVQQ